MAGRRQPIVAVLGHVDHGKTSLLDHIRSLGKDARASVMDREAGGITQHIGATEVPSDILNALCAPLLGGKTFDSPGLLFIDTPGHHSFSTLRSRGGSLADIAILVVDVMEGARPQTIESLRVLKEAKTPFVIAANKIDRIHGWHSKHDRSMAEAMGDQSKEAMGLFEQRYWELVGQFAEHGFNIERYDRVTDFTKDIALVPLSAREGEGIQDLLAVVIGLAERYLAEQLTDIEGSGEGTVLEMKEERGLGKTLDVILHRGSIEKGDEIVLVTDDGGRATRVKGLFTPRGMSEMRDAGNRWDASDAAHAASGLKISAPDLDGVLAGTTLRVVHNDAERTEALAVAHEESKLSIELEEEGVCIKADTVGGLEALAKELNAIEVPIRMASIGQVSRRDIRNTEAASNPLHRVIMAFSTDILPDAITEVESSEAGAKHIGSDIIYRILEEHEEWIEQRTHELEEASREQVVYPARILLLPDHTFRVSKPAVVGVRVVAGRIHVGQYLLKEERRIGRIKSIRSGENSMREAMQGDEVAVAIEGVTVGRQIDEGDSLLVDVPESHAKKLRKMELTAAEQDVFDELLAIHRKDDHFWGR
ncbi:MAG: translation initiation factor IF-2 [Candidatus Thermoplasmatota archaeon]|nr:translation initiation factor IF-2 [Candidatus Thermoplasmatota archaeon]|tara:strand:- start:661 stop:2439 length:1779 start_codon:yes stop_codon:yes gene_type:complete